MCSESGSPWSYLLAIRRKRSSYFLHSPEAALLDPVAAGWTLGADLFLPVLGTEGLLLLCLLLTGLGIGAAHRIQRRAPLGSA